MGKEKRKREDLLRHYVKLRDDVIGHWAKHRAVLNNSINQITGFSIPLYLDIAEVITAPTYYDYLYLHLSDPKYLDIKAIIDEIVTNEPKHNKLVQDFSSGLKGRIHDIINNKDIASQDYCVIDSIMEYNVNNLGEPQTFCSDVIIEYCINKFRGINPKLDIRQLHTNFQLYVDLPFTNEVGHGDEETMKCLQKKVELIELEVVKKLQELNTEANRLADLFNRKLKSRLKELIVHIESGKLNGSCPLG